MTAPEQDFLSGLSDKSREEIIRVAFSLYCEKRALSVRLTEFRNASTEMSIQFQQMKDELQGARAEIKALREQNQHLLSVKALRERELFGRSTEKTEEILVRAMDSGDENSSDPLSEEAEAEEKTRRKSGRAKLSFLVDPKPRNPKEAGKREKDLSRLPVQKVFDYDVRDLNEKYGEGNWRFAFWKETPTVEVIRHSTYLKITCTPVISVGLEHSLVRIPEGNALIPKSLVSPSLLSLIMTDKFNLYLPTYRQEKNSDRFGIEISRQTMSNWIQYACHELLLPLYEYLCDLLRTFEYQQCDETTYTVIHEAVNPRSKHYIWIHRTSSLLNVPPVIIYAYEAGRGADHLRRFYGSLLHQLWITSDAYGAYSAFASDYDGLVTICGCFMHARRRFVEALEILNTDGLSEERLLALPEARALSLIGKIYQEENLLSDLDAQERFEKRQNEVRKAVDAYFDFIHDLDVDNPSVSEKLRDAVLYSRNQEQYLRQFLTDGNIPIDNGAAERSVKPIALGRRNYLFSNTVKGAQSAVITHSLIETANENGADPYYYLKYLLEQMPKHQLDKGRSYLSDMTPWSEAYRCYEQQEKQLLIQSMAPPGNEKPKTPRKKDLRKIA